MSTIVSDLRFAFRSFARQRGAAALTIGTLALAIAANTAVFALVDAVFFRALPYPHASRLVDLNESAPKSNVEFAGVSFEDFDAWRSQATTFEGMGLWVDASVNLSDGPTTERIDGQFVTHDLGRVLGIAPTVGRWFTADEDSPIGPNVVMLGHSLWQSRFGGIPSAIGKTIRINSQPFTIVGVLPPSVVLSGPTAFWLPLRLAARSPEKGNHSFEGVGRLGAGVTIDQARADLSRIHSQISRDRDSANDVIPRVMPLRDRFVSEFKMSGGALGAGVILVLIIACANVAGSMLVRSVVRRRELGIRVAMGASATRLTRQLLTEALALSATAGLIGTVLGRAGMFLLTASANSVPPWLTLGLDGRAVMFSIGLVAATTLAFGMIPLADLRGDSLAGALVAGGGTRMSATRRERRMLSALVVGEIGLAAVLLVTGGLVLRTYQNLLEVDAGFHADGAIRFTVSLPAAKYANGTAQKRLYQTLIARVAAIPGVSHAGVVTCPPFTCHWPAFYDAEEASSLPNDASDPVVLTRISSAGYFPAMGIQLVRGRFFGEFEGGPHGPRPVVINDLFARRLWPGVNDPVGREFRFRGDTSTGNRMTVVGIVKDVRHDGLSRPVGLGVYLPLAVVDSANDFSRMSVIVRSTRDPAALVPALRAALRDIDPELPMFDVKTMRASLNESLVARRALALWLASFAAVALILAVGGIYAALSYVVGRRRREIGIRMALGARSSQVLRMVMRQGISLVAIGLVLGILLGLMLMHFLSSLLFGVSADDPSTYVGAVLVLIVTGALASWLPARRASRVDLKIVLAEGE